jgi:hypothetical protein|tara:strand:- start:5292 stop:5636 length:345 start_codon:yes stop_codon:yes gene_type:complete
MAQLTAQKIVQAGLKPAYAAATAAGDTLINTGIQFFHVKNGSGVSVTASVTPVVTTYLDVDLGLLVKETAKLVLAAGTSGFLGPFEVDAFNSPTGTIELEYTAATTVTVAALYI